jgi:hypothetical protein
LALWFAYDGFVGYPAKNRQENLQQLATLEEREKAKKGPIYPSVTPESVARATEAVSKISGNAQRQALQDVFGGPPSYENAEALFYFGPAFRIRFPLVDGRLGKPVGARAVNSPEDVFLQKALGLVLGLLALYFLWFWIRVRRTHLVLDEAGLTYHGRGPIRWQDMRALDTGRFSRKGWLDLVYDDNGTERRLRLDEYHLAKFDDVVDAICAGKGFENPLPVPTKQPTSPE